MSRIFLIKSPGKRSEGEHGALGEDGFFLTIPCAYYYYSSPIFKHGMPKFNYHIPKNSNDLDSNNKNVCLLLTLIF
jgi:hypothetical protein